MASVAAYQRGIAKNISIESEIMRRYRMYHQARIIAALREAYGSMKRRRCGEAAAHLKRRK